MHAHRATHRININNSIHNNTVPLLSVMVLGGEAEVVELKLRLLIVVMPYI